MKYDLNYRERMAIYVAELLSDSISRRRLTMLWVAEPSDRGNLETLLFPAHQDELNRVNNATKHILYNIKQVMI